MFRNITTIFIYSMTYGKAFFPPPPPHRGSGGGAGRHIPLGPPRVRSGQVILLGSQSDDAALRDWNSRMWHSLNGVLTLNRL